MCAGDGTGSAGVQVGAARSRMGRAVHVTFVDIWPEGVVLYYLNFEGCKLHLVRVWLYQ